MAGSSSLILLTERSSFTLMHFNTLCKAYEPKHLPEEVVGFDARKELIGRQIEEHQCDVISLNEANPSTFFRQQFGPRYHMAFVSKSAFRRLKAVSGPTALREEEMLHDTDDRDDGGFLMVRKGSAVEPVQFFHIPFFEVDRDDPQLGPIQRRYARQHAIAVLCFHRVTGRAFLIVSTHMKANGYNSETQQPSSEDWRRVGHLKQLFEWLASFQTARGGPKACPVVYAGDLNASMQEQSTKFLLEGRASIKGTVHHAISSGHFLWRSVVHDSIARSIARSEQIGGEAAACKLEDFFTILVSEREPSGWHCILDYILYQPEGLVEVASTIIPHRGMPQWREAVDAIPIVGSDHIPITAEFAFV